MTKSIHALQELPALPAGANKQQPPGVNAEEAQQLQLGSLVVSPRQGTVKGYSRLPVKAAFTPPAAGPVTQPVSISFRSDRCGSALGGDLCGCRKAV